MVNEWPTKWTGQYSTVSITCTDIFAWLSRAPALRPMLIQEVLLDGPLAYYPMGEGSESTSAGDESGVVGPTSLTVQQKGSGGTLTFGSSGGPADTLGSPTFTPTDGANGKYLRAALGAGGTGRWPTTRGGGARSRRGPATSPASSDPPRGRSSRRGPAAPSPSAVAAVRPTRSARRRSRRPTGPTASICARTSVMRSEAPR